jgi:predicted HTH domain antitoxin
MGKSVERLFGVACNLLLLGCDRTPCYGHAIATIDEAQRLEAERKAREAFIMELLRQGNISAGRAAELLSIDRWQLSDLMGLYRISPFVPQTSEELEREVAETDRLLS